MALLRDQQELGPLFGQAGEALDLPAGVVEKDYWVTQTLRGLHEAHPDAFVFKGGTSLSKAYGLIERFSEDVDILVLPVENESKNARYKRIKQMTVDAFDGVGETERLEGTNDGMMRVERCAYGPKQDVPEAQAAVIRLDIGFAGAWNPTAAGPLAPWWGRCWPNKAPTSTSNHSTTWSRSKFRCCIPAAL